MPQKRNPIALERLRQLSSTVVGDGQTVLLTAHNPSTGMIDYRSGTQVIETADKARRMYAAYADIVNNLEVDPERSLAEVDADYATMTEVADTPAPPCGRAVPRRPSLRLRADRVRPGPRQAPEGADHRRAAAHLRRDVTASRCRSPSILFRRRSTRSGWWRAAAASAARSRRRRRAWYAAGASAWVPASSGSTRRAPRCRAPRRRSKPRSTRWPRKRRRSSAPPERSRSALESMLDRSGDAADARLTGTLS